ncbi:hypothetical protein GCM10008012_52550 [Rhizobium anhuiense]|nr:hypothetical protein GCM10008012_52550 [Rhizobium anhuiense]
MAKLERQGFLALTQKVLGGAGVLGGIERADHILLGANFLRAQRHGRLQPVLGIPDDAAMNGGRDQKDEERRGQEAQSEQESIFDHGAAIGKKVDTGSAAMIKRA